MFFTLYSGYFMYTDFILHFSGPAFNALTVAQKMHYLSLIGDKWPVMEPALLRSITENL